MLYVLTKHLPHQIDIPTFGIIINQTIHSKVMDKMCSCYITINTFTIQQSWFIKNRNRVTWTDTPMWTTINNKSCTKNATLDIASIMTHIGHKVAMIRKIPSFEISTPAYQAWPSWKLIGHWNPYQYNFLCNDNFSQDIQLIPRLLYGCDKSCR